MAQKIFTQVKNQIQRFTMLPPCKRSLECKWVYKIKYHADRTIERYKARLVVLGNTQVEGQEFNDTLAFIARMVIVHCL